MTGASLDLWLADAAETERLGAELGRRLRAGMTLCLVGDLGAGKTCLVRGLARGLRVDDPGAVASPTYLLVIEHPGPVPLVHMDAYLPGKLAGFLADGGLDYLAERHAVVAVEWADRLRASQPDALPADAVWLTLRNHRRDGLDGRSASLQNADVLGDLDGLRRMFSGA